MCTIVGQWKKAALGCEETPSTRGPLGPTIWELEPLKGPKGLDLGTWGAKLSRNPRNIMWLPGSTIPVEARSEHLVGCDGPDDDLQCVLKPKGPGYQIERPYTKP